MAEPQGHTPFLLRRETILVIFVLATLVVGVMDGISGGSRESWTFGIATILVYGTLAWFTHKRQSLATWVTILVLIVTGSGYLYDGVVALTQGSDVSLLGMGSKALVGIYLTWGALIIYRERHLAE